MSDVVAYDATLVEHGGKWWLFANFVENEGATGCGELCLFHAENPVSDRWAAHELNPVTSDARQSRPAGGFFTHNGKLIRTSQENSRLPASKISSSAYGSKLVFSEIVELDESRYRENRVKTVEPDWNARLVGIHTFNRAGELSTADAKVWRWRWW